MDNNLTEKQRLVLKFITTFSGRNGIPPSLREISQHFNWSSVSSAQDVVSVLRRKGALKTPNRSHSRNAVPATQSNWDGSHMVSMPLMGRIQAGSPLEAIQSATQFFSYPLAEKDLAKQHFALEVDGFSMKDVGIFPGDLLIVESNKKASSGDIVVAMTFESEATVKRYASKGSALYKRAIGKNERNLPPALLIPENKEFKPIHFGFNDEDCIIGIVKSLVRKNI